MNPVLDRTPDLALAADGLEPVTFRRRGAAQGILLPAALRRLLTRAEIAASGGAALFGDLAWYLPVTPLAAPPAPGDLLVDAHGARWTILALQASALGGPLRCLTRNLALAARLDSLVTIQRAEFAPGASGAAEPRWRDEYSGVPARLAPLDNSAQLDHALWGTLRRFRLTLADDLPLDVDRRILAPDGALYHVVRAGDRQQIDQLPWAEVVLVSPAPENQP
jgi:hypothetical protein